MRAVWSSFRDLCNWNVQGVPGKVSKDHKLTLAAVSREDRGEYLCIAANTEGESRQTLTLNILCKLRKTIAVI